MSHSATASHRLASLPIHEARFVDGLATGGARLLSIALEPAASAGNDAKKGIKPFTVGVLEDTSQ